MGPDGELVERFSWLADPGVVIPPRATEVHGITTKMAQEQGRNAAEVVSEVVKEIRRVLDAGIPLVVYNASYDLTLTNWEARRYGVEPLDNPRPIIDPLVIDRALDTSGIGLIDPEIDSHVFDVRQVMLYQCVYPAFERRDSAG